MPRDGGGTLREYFLISIVPCTAMHQVDFRLTGGAPAGGMDMEATEIAGEIEGLWDGEVGEVLITEDEDFALGRKEGELIFTGGGESAELNVGDDSTDGGGYVFGLDVGGEKVGEGLVGVVAMFDVHEGFQRRIFLFMVPRGEVVRVL